MRIILIFFLLSFQHLSAQYFKDVKYSLREWNWLGINGIRHLGSDSFERYAIRNYNLENDADNFVSVIKKSDSIYYACRKCKDSAYRLFFDLSLMEGDSMKSFCPDDVFSDEYFRSNSVEWNYVSMVGKVDSLRWVSYGGNLRKTWYLKVKTGNKEKLAKFVDSLGYVSGNKPYPTAEALWSGAIMYFCFDDKVVFNEGMAYGKMKDRLNPCDVDTFFKYFTGIESNNLNDAFEIYPMPVQGVLNIVSSQVISRINLLDILGRELYCKELDTNGFNIDISTIDNGIYYILIEFESGQRVIRKFVKSD